MTNLTREQIEYCIKTNSSTEDEHRQICALALRALDTPSKEEIEAKAYERAACAAEGPLFEANHNTGEARFRGDENGNWTVPQPIAGFQGSDYGTGRYDAAKAIRALSPSTTRYVVLPDGHVAVPVDLVKATRNIVTFNNLPVEAKRPDMFQRLMSRLEDTLKKSSRAMIGGSEMIKHSHVEPIKNGLKITVTQSSFWRGDRTESYCGFTDKFGFYTGWLNMGTGEYARDSIDTSVLDNLANLYKIKEHLGEQVK